MIIVLVLLSIIFIKTSMILYDTSNGTTNVTDLNLVGFLVVWFTCLIAIVLLTIKLCFT